MNRKLWIAPLLLAVTLPLAGCGSTFMEESSSDAPLSSSRDVASEQSLSGKVNPAQDNNPTQENPAPEQYVIKTANMAIQVEDIQGKLIEARKVVASHKGEISYVTSRIKNQEMTASTMGVAEGETDRRYRPEYLGYVVGDYAVVMLKVPANDLEALLTDLRKLGTPLSERGGRAGHSGPNISGKFSG